MKRLLLFPLLLCVSLSARADYVVNQNLGILPLGTTPLSNTTAGGNNNADFPGGAYADGSALNYGTEFVYRLEITQRSVIRLESSAITGDPDFFLLDGLGTSVDAGSGKNVANDVLDWVYLDATPPGTASYLPLEPGVYYIAVESYNGTDAEPLPGDASFTVALELIPLPNYTQNHDLGVIASGSPVSAPADVTTGKPNAAIYHGGVTGSTNNWGREVVYRFEVLQPSVVTLTSTSAFGDPDWFLLDSLQTGYDPATGKSFAAGALDALFLDGVPPDTGSFLAIPAGVYYIAVEAYNGVDGSVTNIDVSFSFDLSVAVASDPQDFAIDLGVLAVNDVALNFDTDGSAFDTELAIFDAAGTLLFENDDLPGLGTASGIDIPAGLPVGTYTAVVGGYDTEWSDPFGFTPGGETGDWVLNYPLGYGGFFATETGTTSNAFPVLEVQFFDFEIIATPTPVINDIGVIAEEGQPVALDTVGSAFDTQLYLYDPAGFFHDPNGDFFEGGQPYYDDLDFAGGDYRSYLSYPDGLPAGIWYACVIGYSETSQVSFAGFGVAPGTDADFGPFAFRADGGSGLVIEDRTGTLPAGGAVQWFAFEVVAPSVAGITIESISYNAGTGMLTLTWSSGLAGPFDIEELTDAAGHIFGPVPGQSGIVGTTTSFAVDPVANPSKLYRVFRP